MVCAAAQANEFMSTELPILQSFDLNQITPSRWKNGGGSTREIACFPHGANMDSFGWRISVASIAQGGPFSAFAGVDRQIMLLGGDGVRLQAASLGMDHALDQPWQPFAFSGDVALDCTLLGGESTDFNVMTRRGQWKAQVNVLADAARAGLSPAGLCMVLQGRWKTADGTLLEVGQGFWWTQAQAMELRSESQDCRLVLVNLEPQT